MDTTKIEFHFLLVAFAEVAILSAIIATLQARKKLARRRFRVLLSLEVFAFWLLGTLLMAIGLTLWISTDL